MNKRIKAKWIAALRSGDYKQGQNKLRPTTLTFCCLGVLCNIHAQEHPKFAATQKIAGMYDGREEYLSPKIRGWAALGDAHMETLSQKNDACGWNFAQIADWIEEKL